MRVAHVNTSWELLRESSDAGRRARRRLFAAGGLTLLLSGLLTAIGLAIVVLAFVFVVVIAALNLVLSWIVGRKGRANPVKDAAYECGVPAVTDPHADFSVKF